MDFSVVIPAYNEEQFIAKTIDEVKKYLRENFSNYEIIVVDDKSNDDTLEVLRGIDNILVLRNLKNHGKGYSVKKGVMKARGDIILFMDADNSTPIDTELNKLYRYIKDYDMVVASRALAESDVQIRQNIIKTFLGRAGNTLIKVVLGTNINDTQCGFKLFNKKIKNIFNKLTIEDWGFDFELIHLASSNNFKIKEVPVVWRNRSDSRVKWYNYFTTLWQVFKVRIYHSLGKYN